MQESDYEFGVQHERWLANARSGSCEVWCSNTKCSNSEQPQTVVWISEYGQGWYEPEECELCHSAWTEDQPEEEEEDEDDSC